jgi:lysozyme-like protein
MSPRVCGSWSPYRARLLVVVGLLAAGMAVVGFGAPVVAVQVRQPPASVGAGVHLPGVGPAGVTDALRCAKPARYVHFKKKRAVIAVAVGMAESYCQEHAKGHNGPTGGCPNGSVDRGLWQINSCYHPEVGKHCAFKANCNARAAKHISDHGKNWSPWSAYNSGAYRQFLEVAQQAVDQVWGAPLPGDSPATDG